MTLLEAISPTSRALLKGVKFRGGVHVNPVFITRANAHLHKLKVHVKFGYNKTLCGLLIENCQEDIGPMNCQRCARIQQRKSRTRAILRLNGRKVSAQQTRLID